MRGVVLICCGLALASASGALIYDQHAAAFTIATISMLVCAQVAALLASKAPNEVNDAMLGELAERIKRNCVRLDELSTRTSDQAQALAEMRHAERRKIKPAAASNQPAPTSETSPALPPHSAPGFGEFSARLPANRGPRPVLAGSAADLFLEPIVKVAEGRTAHYRASLKSDERGPAQSETWRDLTLLRKSMPVIEKLHARRQSAFVIAPVSASTLLDPGRVKEIASLTGASQSFAAAVVLEVNEADLVALSEQALENLAWLASRGLRFCLGGAGEKVLDFATLSQLGFCFLDVHVEQCLDDAGRATLSAVHLSQQAAIYHMDMLVSGVDTAELAATTMQITGLARGAAFAPPRPVRAAQREVGAVRQVA